jgi:hypothetical protein
MRRTVGPTLERASKFPGHDVDVAVIARVVLEDL